MGSYVFLNSENIVYQGISGADETNYYNGLNAREHYSQLFNTVCKRTSYNTRGGVHYQSDNNTPSIDQSKAFRKNYAGIGYIYDEQRDAFIPPKPFESWILNEFSCLWEAPIPYPTDGKRYIWNEDILNWEETNF